MSYNSINLAEGIQTLVATGFATYSGQWPGTLTNNFWTTNSESTVALMHLLPLDEYADDLLYVIQPDKAGSIAKSYTSTVLEVQI